MSVTTATVDMRRRPYPVRPGRARTRQECRTPSDADVVGSTTAPQRRVNHEVPRTHLRRRVDWADATPEEIAATFAGARRVRPGGGRGRRVRRRRGPAADGDGDDRARARRRAHAHRRPVRGDQGAARRLLPARVQGPRRGADLGGADPRGHDRRASRCARSWTTRRWAARRRRPPRPPPPDRTAERPRRPPVPARVGTGGRRPRPHPRRSRPRRGGGAGRVPDRARALARARAARQPGGLDRHRGAQPRARPDPLRAPLGRPPRRARGRAASARRRRGRARSPSS